MWYYADIETIGDVPRFHARRRGEHTALIEGERRMSFDELDRASNRIANGLKAAGVTAGANVGVYCQNRIEYWVLCFGVQKSACTPLPMNWRLAAPELAVIVEDAGVDHIFCESGLRDAVDALNAATSVDLKIVEFNPDARDNDGLEAWLGSAPDSDPETTVDPRQAAFLMYTSGTTGKPKGVRLTHRGLNYMRLCEHLEPMLQWQDDDVMLTVMPNFHLVGTGLSLQALYNGVTVSMLPALDPGAMCKLIQRDKPTVTILVPTAVQMVLDHPEAANTDFTCFRLVMYAGSAITAALLKRAMEEMTPNMMQFYGATETSGAATLLRPQQHDLENEARLKSCGTPLPFIEIKIIDDQGNEVPQGQVGEFVIQSPSLAEGYYEQPDKTAEAFRNGWYHTGDAGFRDEEGLYYIVDRVKDMIVSGGENVYSAEVEQALAKHAGVSQCAVIGLPHEKWGEQVTAMVVANDPTAADADALIAHCRELIAAYKAPKAVHFVDALPLTPSGKVQKKLLRDEWLEKGA